MLKILGESKKVTKMQSILIYLLKKVVGIGAHGRLYKPSLLITTISLFSSFLASILGDIYVKSANPLNDPLVWIFVRNNKVIFHHFSISYK